MTHKVYSDGKCFTHELPQHLQELVGSHLNVSVFLFPELIFVTCEQLQQAYCHVNATVHLQTITVLIELNKTKTQTTHTENKKPNI